MSHHCKCNPLRNRAFLTSIATKVYNHNIGEVERRCHLSASVNLLGSNIHHKFHKRHLNTVTVASPAFKSRLHLLKQKNRVAIVPQRYLLQPISGVWREM